MTTIRRITVSQIDGSNANSTDTNAIRPFGETAFYLDNSNKLTLMMFDGTRTHRKSKVLSPGTLYGSNADSGEEHIAHTEVGSGTTDSENDDLWLVQNEGTISYRRIDGEAKTLKVHWTAKVFYGEEFYD